MTDTPIPLPDWPGYAVSIQGMVFGKTGNPLAHDKAGRVNLFKGNRAHCVYPAELLAGVFTNQATEMAADLARLKLENGKLKKLVATRERQRDDLAAKILDAKGSQAHLKPKKEEEDDE